MRSWQRSSAASIRFRIMACVITAIAVMGSCLIVTVQLNQKSMERIGGSYTTNAELTEVTALLADTERALEAYMEYRTFESIDSYYHFLAVSESAMERLHESPSTDSLLQKEYIVRQLTGSFFAYSLNAVTAQRANDSWRSEDNYRRSLQCYALLQSEVEELNMMFMRRNAADYAQNQGNFLKLARVSIAFTFIFFSLVLGAASMPLRSSGRIGGTVIAWYFATSLFATVFGVAMAFALNPSMAAASERAVDVDAVRSDLQMFDDFLVQDRYVAKFHTRPALQPASHRPSCRRRCSRRRLWTRLRSSYRSRSFPALFRSSRIRAASRKW